MTRCTTILIMCVALLAACSSPRKACRKADRHITRAIWLCPDVLQRDSATATFFLPGDSSAGTIGYTQWHLDSLLAACAELAAVRTVDTLPAQVVYIKSEPVKTKAVQRFRTKVCRPDPVHVDVDSHSIRIWMDTTTGELRYLLTIWPVVQEQKVPCPPAVDRPSKELTGGGTPWYAWPILVLCILGFLWLISTISSWNAWD